MSLASARQPASVPAQSTPKTRSHPFLGTDGAFADSSGAEVRAVDSPPGSVLARYLLRFATARGCESPAPRPTESHETDEDQFARSRPERMHPCGHLSRPAPYADHENDPSARSEERRVGKECRSRWS